MEFLWRTERTPREFSCASQAMPLPNEGAIRMTFDLALAGLVALGLLVYLTAVLIRPERF